jgi:RHS repeat-associated protein
MTTAVRRMTICFLFLRGGAGLVVVVVTRLFVVGLAWVVVGLVGSSAIASAEGSPAGERGGASSSLGSSLVTPGSPAQGEQAQAAEEAKLTNPDAVAEREASQTKFENLNSEQAAALASEAFPAAIDEPAGGPPKLPAGQQVTSYLTDNAARVSLPEGKRGVIESSEPLAVETSTGQLLPIDLALSESGGSFALARPAVPLSIPKRLQEGVSVAGSGVSLTPVNASGAAVGGVEGSIDGTVAFYGGVELGSDVDMIVKPLTRGFEEDALLRSVRSPQQLSFRLGLPEGATVRQAGGGSRPVEVIKEGQVLAVVMPPSAEDAAGTAVPVSMSVSGDTLTLSVDEHSGEYEYPIEVDPTVAEINDFVDGTKSWQFVTNSEYEVICGVRSPGTYIGVIQCPFEPKAYKNGNYGDLLYTTQGESKIYDFRAETYMFDSPQIHTYVAIAHSTYEVGPVELANSETKTWHEVSTTGSNENTALYEVIAKENGDFKFESLMYGNEISIRQEAGPHVSMDTSEEVVGGEENALYGNRWVSATSGNWGFKANATDPGLGVMSETWSSVSAAKWGISRLLECAGVQCNESASPTYSVKGSGTEILPEGEDTVELKVKDPVGFEASTGAVKVKVDNAPPHNLTLSGLPSTHEISDGQHFLLKASATSKLAGMASVALTMDGQEVGSPSKGCSPGECTAGGEWTLSGESYAAGTYTLAVVATDTAGNVATENYSVTIHHAGDVAVGPGSVSPTMGELGLSATDVSVGAPGASLTVGRSYRSRHPGVEAESPLGPQWGLSVGASESLYKTPSGSMVLTGARGEQSVFASNGKGGYTSPPGDAGLVLSEKKVGSATDFLLSENGAVTTFAVPSGGSGGVWEPSVSEGAGGTNAVTFAYKTEGGVTEPTEELAPVPAGVSCSPTLTQGCRALSFVYATKTKESIGESPSQWGEYKGRLAEVTFTAYEPSSKEMKTKAVAKYVYDEKGRLRAEWNPQITPELKTVYGYDGEGHVTAIAAAGQQPWLVEQGTIVSDASPGRVLAFARPAATSEAVLKTEMEEPAPAIKTAPTLSSTTPTVGVRISVNLTSEKTPGTWSNGPLAYSYQWEDCNKEGKECTAIPGAVNEAYYPVLSDEGHELVAEVVALNLDGSGTASSNITGVVAKGTPDTPLPEPPSVGSLSVLTLDYQVPLSGSEPGLPKMSSTEVAKWGQTDVPAEATAMAVFPPDDPMGWPAKEYTRASIYYLDGRDRSVNFASPTGGISTAEYNLYNDVIRTLSPDNRATALAAGEEKSKEVSKELDTESAYNETGNEPGTELLSSLGPKHTVDLTNGTKAEAREHTVYSYNEGAPTEGGPYHLATMTTEGAQIAGKEEAASVRTTKMSYSGEGDLGWTLRKPTSVTIDPGGLNLTHGTVYEAATGNVIETRLPAGETASSGSGVSVTYVTKWGSVGKENGQFTNPKGVAVASNGDVYVVDAGNDRVEEFSATGAYVTKWGSVGKENGQFTNPKGVAVASNGDVYVVDTSNDRVQEFSATGTYIAKWGSEGKENGQFKGPTGVAVASNGDVYVVDTGNDRVQEFSATGTYIAKWGSEGKENGQFKSPKGVAVAANGDVYVVDEGNNRVEEFSATGTYLAQFGSKGTGSGEFEEAEAIAVAASGDVYVTGEEETRIQVFSATGEYITKWGTTGKENGEFECPGDMATVSGGDVYVTDGCNDRVQEFSVASADAHDTQTIYYSAAANGKYKACGEHPEWANLPCQTQPAAQPEGSLPKLQVTTYTYNVWDEPETTTNTSGTTTRTMTATYDSAGRLKTTSVSSTVGKTLPTVTDKYSEALGALEEQSNEGKTKPVTSHFNTLGQLTSYTDAAEGTTTYEYDEDGRVKKVNDGKGAETYTYSKTTGLPTELLNEYGTTKLAFTGTYDVEGNLLTEGYPNGMTATYTYNQVGKPTALVYKKISNCTEEGKEKCKWFKDAIVPSIHGQWLEQTSTLSHQAYTYDADGRLTQVQNTPAGQGCTTRLYAYEEDTNRTSLTAYQPNSKNECSAETASTVEKHTYDTADRLVDTGTKYNEFGDITALPATDAGGKEPSEELTSEYYVDNQLASQTQNGQTIGYHLDPAGRTIETVATGKRAETITNHYAGPGDTPAWTSNTSSETTRNIPGITGTLTATQSNLSEPVLQLTNLHGDIIATAYLSETATALASKADTSEYGVPTTSLPPKYSWLGSLDIPTELSSGVLDMGARSYVPQLGRFLQPDPIPGGSANAYAYTFGDPVNTSDPSGQSTILELIAGHAAQVGQEGREAEEAKLRAERAAEEAAARLVSEEASLQARWAAEWAAGPQYAGEEEWGEEEEWYEEEEVAFHPGEGRQASPLVEEGLFFQPESTAEGSATQKHPITVCVAHSTAAGHPCIKYVHWWSGGLKWLKKHVAKPVWHVLKATAIREFHDLGAGDAVCTTDACSSDALTIYDGFECADEGASDGSFGGSCESFSSDLSEYF